MTSSWSSSALSWTYRQTISYIIDLAKAHHYVTNGHWNSSWNGSITWNFRSLMNASMWRILRYGPDVYNIVMCVYRLFIQCMYVTSTISFRVCHRVALCIINLAALICLRCIIPRSNIVYGGVYCLLIHDSRVWVEQWILCILVKS